LFGSNDLIAGAGIWMLAGEIDKHRRRLIAARRL
jgi:hypothetical protein